MNKTVELVNKWADFEDRHPDGSIDDFCRFFLTNQDKEREKARTPESGAAPYSEDGYLLKIIGRISKLNMSYANLALRGTGLNQLEEFRILQTVKQEKSPRKTDVIYANLLELSSGTDMLNRMRKRGLLTEYADKDDKRSKRVELTSQGEKVVKEATERIRENSTMLLHTLSPEDQQFCIRLLAELEMKLAGQWTRHKGFTASTRHQYGR